MTGAATQELPPEQREHILTRIEQELERRKARASFLNFLPYWHFVNREDGLTYTFGECPVHGDLHPSNFWPGQQVFAELTAQHDWIFALKAGKLGFSEMECAYDGWRAVMGPPNTRVHIFSRSDLAAQDLLGYVRYGIDRLPEWMRPTVLFGEAGGNTTHSLKLRVAPHDIRTIVCYASGPDVSIDQTCQHAHVDELARMLFARQTWQAVYSTVAPGGTCHVVTRGKGEANFAAELWKTAKAGTSKLYPFFQPWSARTDRDRSWYERTAGSMVPEGLRQFAPETEEDAIAGDDQSDYIAIELWDRCEEKLPDLVTFDEGNKPIVDKTPLVVAVDAAITNDCFGIVAVSRHPERKDDVAVRAVKKWDPPPGGRITFDEPESFLMWLLTGGCPAGHAKSEMERRAAGADGYPRCEACGTGIVVPPHNVVCIVYDRYELEGMMQTIRKKNLTWVEEFSQMQQRAIADSELRTLIINRRITHGGSPLLREHIGNAAAKIDRDDRRIRIIKKAPERKVDLAVCTSMATYQCMYLLLG